MSVVEGMGVEGVTLVREILKEEYYERFVWKNIV